MQQRLAAKKAMTNLTLQIAATCLALVLAGTDAQAVDCRATGGQREGQEAWTVRHLTLIDDQLIVVDDFQERFVLLCSSLGPGLLCRGSNGDLDIVMIANGERLLESIADSRTGREKFAHSYLCERPLTSSSH